MKILPLLLCLVPLTSIAEVNFVITPEGEVASDRLDILSTDPAYDWANDPFLKLPGYSNVSDRPKPVFRLQATMPDTPMAVINDEVVRLGDQVHGKRVYRIGKDFVLLEEKGSILEVGLYETSNQEEPPPQRAPASKRVTSEPEIRIEELLK